MKSITDRLALLRQCFQADMGQSPLLASLRLLQTTRLRLKQGRNLTPTEIDQLIDQGNSAEDWREIRLSQDGLLAAISGTYFAGSVLLQPPSGFWCDASGLRWQAGIRNSTVRNCIIGNACVENIGRLENVVVEKGAVLAHSTLITCAANQLFSLGQTLHPGDEGGSRSLWLWDNLDLDTLVLAMGLTPSEQKTFQAECEAFWAELGSDFGYVGEGAAIINTRNVQNTWVGPGCIIAGASLVSGSALTGEIDHGVLVACDARITNSILQSGCEVSGGASVTRSLLLEASGVAENGMVSESVLGSNTHVAKGEVTASLVGPFVGFHHQALLISALWPEGRGNVAYGANVGSNHTGKKPDQEIRPGEGMFFGLGCTIKFPANFEAAPYSLLASGIATLPQRVSYPFSLLVTPTLPPTPETQGLNEIRPGFMWSENLYALARSSFKYLDRDKSKKPILSPGYLPGGQIRDGFFAGRLFAPELTTLVVQAYLSLSAYSLAQDAPPVILPQALPGLGKNFMRGDYLAKAQNAYGDYLRLILLRWAAEPMLWQDATLLQGYCGNALLALGFKVDHAWRDQITAWLPRLEALPLAVSQSLQRDKNRGIDIMDDYATFHGDPQADAVVKRIQNAVGALVDSLPQV
jgi:hypothetical protein